ncbi:MAG: glutathione S-transferase N-terminal domain-containing protein [Oscillospiraceae bacterium]|nr:glutathione S-transferase N-terminal domain-containing protein [Oscillospiraceae bacterium]
MKELKIFYLEGCPYCRKAAEALMELKTETPAYEKVRIEWIEETRSPEIAGKYDYYYVPSIFCGEEKLYECSPRDNYGEIKRQLETALHTAAAEKP